MQKVVKDYKNKKEQQLTVNIKRVVYKKDNFYILRTNKGTAKGYILDAAQQDIKDTTYQLTGHWVIDKYGKSFVFNEAIMTTNPMFFFLDKIVKIGKKLSQTLVDHYGDDLEQVIEKNPEKLKEIKGIAKKRVEKIINSWDKYKHLRKLSTFLAKFNTKASVVIRIYNHFEDKSLEIVQTNPYAITVINGIGFKTADEIALKMGIKENAKERIIACGEYILLSEGTDSGHCYIPIDEFEKKIKEHLKINNTTSMDILSYFGNNDTFIIKDDKYIGFTYSYYMEKYIVNYLKQNAQEKPLFTENEITSFIEKYEKENNIEFAEEQKEAIYAAGTHKLFILTGYAGTGKSSVTKAILTLLNTKTNSIIGTALSGIASRRLQQVSGFSSMTLHSLLEFNGSKFTKNHKNKLDFDVIVIDEAGMLNINLVYSLLKAVKPDTRIIFIGDDAQLPPIGLGNIFCDMINLNLAKTVRLNKIFRQSEDSVINMFAQEIRKGFFPENFRNKYMDWHFLDCGIKNYYQIKKTLNETQKAEMRDKINNRITTVIENIVQTNKNNISDKLLSLQILVPQKNGILGYHVLNNKIQKILNNPDKYPENKKIKVNDRIFCLDDKIIHIQNKDMSCIDPDSNEIYKKRIFNGTLGLITEIDQENEIVVAKMLTGDTVIYNFVELGDVMDLAYVLTVHKAQGSEFKNVIIPISLSNFIMLQNQWLYTAITRAKSKVILVGESYGFKYACKNTNSKQRNTWSKYITEIELNNENNEETSLTELENFEENKIQYYSDTFMEIF
jgi:exodeoxyribonuclease V alpha subunit